MKVLYVGGIIKQLRKSMTDRLYTDEEVENINREIDKIKNLITLIFKGKNNDTAFNYFLDEYISPIQQGGISNTEPKTIINIDMVLNKLKGLEKAIQYKFQEYEYANLNETYRCKDNFLNSIKNAYNLVNNIDLRYLNTEKIQHNLVATIKDFDNNTLTFTYFQKKLNDIIKKHYTNKGDISFIFDIIPNLDIYKEQKEQIDIKGKIKKLFKETNDLKQKRKYLNTLIYMEYLKELDKESRDNILILVKDSTFNKKTYKQIKTMENIPLNILTKQQLADEELNGVISRHTTGLLSLN